MTFNWIFSRSFYQHVQYVQKGNRSEFDAGFLCQKSMADSSRTDRFLGAYVMFGEYSPFELEFGNEQKGNEGV